MSAGKDWFGDFTEINENIAVRKPEGLSGAGERGMN
jgi:hypothetical protein